MIRVSPGPKPSSFDAQVAQPGAARLTAVPPSVPPVPDKYWDGHRYWSRVREELWRAYDGFCCYTCVWIDPSSAYWGTVEHFEPKSTHPSLAYDWDNYRLASTVPNRSKSDHEDVLDPFLIGDDWFQIDPSDLTVEPGAGVPPGSLAAVWETISRLNLDRAEFVLSRRRFVDFYLSGAMTLDAIRAANPFLAREIERWGI